MRELGPTAIPALDGYIARVEDKEDALILRRDLANRAWKDGPRDWRGWTWREQRLLDYLDSAPLSVNNFPAQP